MEKTVEIDIINENDNQKENILDKDDIEIEQPEKIILENENNISIIIEDTNKNSTEELQHSRVSNIVIDENEVLDTKNMKTLTSDNTNENHKSFRLTSSCSVDSFDKIMKSNSGSHGAISEATNTGQENTNPIIGHPPNKLSVDKINVRPSSISNFEFKENTVNSIHHEVSSECTSCEQVPPLKTKRPSLNFMKHITGFSEISKTKAKNKGSSKEDSKTDILASKKAGSIKKVIIRSDSNIIGHFENVVVKEKKNKQSNETSSNDDETNSKKNSKNYDDNPSHTASLTGSGNSRHNIISSSYIAENEMNNYLSKAYSKSMPTTMNYNGNNVINTENVDILDQNYDNKKNPEEMNNLFIDSSSNGNINYNDFLFSDDENIENGEQSNINHEAGTNTVDTQNQAKEGKKKVKTNAKNVTFNESECYYIPNIYEIHITEDSVLYCTKCKKKEHIVVKREYSKTFWILFIVLLLCGVVFAWIPFLFNRFKYYSFYCKVCKKRILKLQQAEE